MKSLKPKTSGVSAAIANSGVDCLMILGDLTDLNQISKGGTVVTLHGREEPRSFSLPDEATAASVWQALAEQAVEAVREDRQFFCVTFAPEAVPANRLN